MNAHRLLAALPLLFAACLSPQPPVPAPRVFDPRPLTTPRRGHGPHVHVEAPAHLGQDFVVRVAPDEVVFDAENRWIMPPAELVEAALLRRLGAPSARPEAAGAALHLVLERFELDIVAEPKARIVVHARFGSGDLVGPFTVETVARSRGPEGMTAAMAEALAKVGDWAAGGG
jgi:ABC-type uncharacterized transport system auxiliary subunit